MALVAAVMILGAGSAGDDKTKTKCLDDCKRNYRDRVEICNDLYNSPGSAYYHNSDWHKTCLGEAKTWFDNCRSTCE